jgi:proteasome accessory factor B
MQKAERLLDLAAFLLRSTEPVSWREIQEHFPGDYAQAAEEASIRKFERDKAELLELGIPIRYTAGDEDMTAGYLVDRDDFYLPDLKLAVEDLALLYLAGSAALAQGAFPYARDLAHALNKLSFAARAPGASEAAAVAARHLSGEAKKADKAKPTEETPGIGERLDALSGAIAGKKKVHLVYAGADRGERTERDVDPYGLYQRGGSWFLAGYCHLRHDFRSFHLDRIEVLEVNRVAPKTPDFDQRPGFSLAGFATRETWEYAIHPAMRCLVRLDPPLSAEVSAAFGPKAKRVEGSEKEGSVQIELTVTNGEGLLRQVLSLGDRAEILEPAALRSRAREILLGLAGDSGGGRA